MNKMIIFILLLICVYFIYKVVDLSTDLTCECKLKQLYLEQLIKRQIKIDEMRIENNNLKNHIYMLESKSNINNIKYSDDIKEAVKYAMVCAHPDNGGDNNTFIKYRKLYQSINDKR